MIQTLDNFSLPWGITYKIFLSFKVFVSCVPKGQFFILFFLDMGLIQCLEVKEEFKSSKDEKNIRVKARYTTLA